MTPRHHPGGDLLFDYATGALGPGPRLVVAAHLGACETCRRAVAKVEAAGGVLISSLPGAAMNADALALALARIERPPSPEPSPASAPADWIAVPAEVAEAARRRRWAGPGVWVAPLAAGPGKARSYLVRMGPGVQSPRHAHRGNEYVCVLKGALRDGDRLYRRGDFALNDESVDHRPRITQDGECICLVATDDAIAPRDWLVRLLQPFLGI
jgi:putative transcriptional regulator